MVIQASFEDLHQVSPNNMGLQLHPQELILKPIAEVRIGFRNVL